MIHQRLMWVQQHFESAVFVPPVWSLLNLWGPHRVCDVISSSAGSALIQRTLQVPGRGAQYPRMHCSPDEGKVWEDSGSFSVCECEPELFQEVIELFNLQIWGRVTVKVWTETQFSGAPTGRSTLKVYLLFLFTARSVKTNYQHDRCRLPLSKLWNKDVIND